MEIKPVVVDDVIRLDPNSESALPDWAHSLLHPKGEIYPPLAFQVSALEIWLHDQQKSGNGVLLAEDLFEDLEATGMRARCLGLHEAEAIKKCGAKFFRENFGSEGVFCWRTVVVRSDGMRFTPFVSECNNEVTLRWFLIDCRRHLDSPVFLHPKR